MPSLFGLNNLFLLQLLDQFVLLCLFHADIETRLGQLRGELHLLEARTVDLIRELLLEGEATCARVQHLVYKLLGLPFLAQSLLAQLVLSHCLFTRLLQECNSVIEIVHCAIRDFTIQITSHLRTLIGRIRRHQVLDIRVADVW